MAGPTQLSFDDYVAAAEATDPEPGSFDFDKILRNALARALKDCPLSRAQVAARMTDLIFGDADEGEITKAQLDAWTAPSREAWRFPLSYLPAFIQATGAVHLLDLLARPCGCIVLRGEHAVLLELGSVMAAKRELSEREARLKKAIPKDMLDGLLEKLGVGS